MELSKEFLYNRDKFVLLICDFYETMQIPQAIYEIKDNLALFPIANIPLIEYILNNLNSQHFKNIIISGKKIESIIAYLQGTNFNEILNIRFLKCNGNSLGDIFRLIDDNGFEFKDLIVMYANHYTNIPLNRLLKKQKRTKDSIMTVFTHSSPSKNSYTHLYALKNGKILYYDKTNTNKIDMKELIPIAKNNKSIEINTQYSGPTIAVVSSNIFSMFTENFDFNTLGDFITGILSTGIYSYKMNLLTEEDLLSKSNDYQITTEYSTQFYSTDSAYSGAIFTETLYCSEEPETFYSIELNTLYDYYKMNIDVAEKTFAIFKLQKTPELIKGKVKNSMKLLNSFVGEKSFINGNLKNCIVWENCNINDDYEGYIFCKDDKIYNLYEAELESGLEDDFQAKNIDLDIIKEDSFFNDVNSYLSSCIYSPRFATLNLNDVFKQISLLRIVWNASKSEVIEAFAYFFIDSLNLDFLEDCISKCSIFFGILAEFVKTKEDQEFILKLIYDYLTDLEYSDNLRAQIFFSFSYLFVQNNIVDKQIVKKYNKMYKTGIF